MEKPTDDTANSDVESAMPLYEPPVAVKLGEVDVGTGQIVVCQSGSSNATLCQTGSPLRGHAQMGVSLAVV